MKKDLGLDDPNPPEYPELERILGITYIAERRATFEALVPDRYKRAKKSEMKMNREQLQDLIKLANNNDNENEANSAARSVCQILDSYTFPNEVSSEFDYIHWCQRHRKLKSNCGCK